MQLLLTVAAKIMLCKVYT